MNIAESPDHTSGLSAAAARDQIATEVERVARRWQQLPLDRALSASPAVHDLIQALADEVATSRGWPPRTVPDLGPAVLMDQLHVMLFDHAEAGLDPVRLAESMTHLRRAMP